MKLTPSTRGLIKLALLGLMAIVGLTACGTSQPLTVPSPTDLPEATPIVTPPGSSPSETGTDPTEDLTPEGPLEPENQRVFRILPERSETRFYIDEVLFGAQKTVVGRTNDISGEILLDMASPQAVQIGVIEINALSILTDDSFRNRALRSQILESNKDEFQFIIFEPTAIAELPEDVVFGEAVIVEMTGDLTIRDITQPATFTLTVVPVSENELSGMGTAVVTRAAFDLQIPSVTGVAQVSEEVRLEIDFVAIVSDE
jgi:polyisoprenoid-binding protein YceI